MWPMNFQYHSQAAATSYGCVGYVKMVAYFSCAAVQTFQEAEIHVFRVYGHWSSANKVRVSIS